MYAVNACLVPAENEKQQKQGGEAVRRGGGETCLSNSGKE